MGAYTTLLEILGCGSITVHFSQCIIFGYLRVHVSHTLGDQQLLRGIYAFSKFHQIIHCSHIQSMAVDEDSDQALDM